MDPEAVLTLYFEKRPPFGDGKKKSEFPDALSLFALKRHLATEEKIYVVSDDNDMRSFCASDPQLLSVDSLDRLLDLYNQHKNARTAKIKHYLASDEGAIKEKIREYLENCEVYNSSTWEDAEVDGGLTVTHVGDIEPSVVSFSDDESQVTFDVDVDFEVTVTGPDFNNGIYDREEGRIFTFDSTSRTKSISRIYTVELWLYYQFVDGAVKDVEIVDMNIPGVSSGIEVAVEENEGEWY